MHGRPRNEAKLSFAICRQAMDVRSNDWVLCFFSGIGSRTNKERRSLYKHPCQRDRTMWALGSTRCRKHEPSSISLFRKHQAYVLQIVRQSHSRRHDGDETRNLQAKCEWRFLHALWLNWVLTKNRHGLKLRTMITSVRMTSDMCDAHALGGNYERDRVSAL